MCLNPHMALDLSKPADVVKETFDADDVVKKDFQDSVSAEVLAFAEAFAPAHSFFMSAFQKECTGGVQRGLVAGLMHGVLDDSLTSVKLLLSGKMGPSGNVARQAMEGICMTLLAAHSGTVILSTKDRKGTEECSYWKLVVDEDDRSEGNRAPHQLIMNAERLGVSDESAQQLNGRSRIDIRIATQGDLPCHSAWT